MLEVVRKGNKEYATEIPYSTTERRIGTWIDGKPLYEKVITGTTGSTTDGNISTTEVNTNISNIDKFFIREAFCYNAYGESLLIPYFSNAGHVIKAMCTETKLKVIINR